MNSLSSPSAALTGNSQVNSLGIHCDTVGVLLSCQWSICKHGCNSLSLMEHTSFWDPLLQWNPSWQSALSACLPLSGGCLSANKPGDVLTLDQECYWSPHLWSWRGEKDTLPLVCKGSNWVNWPCRDAGEKRSRIEREGECEGEWVREWWKHWEEKR